MDAWAAQAGPSRWGLRDPQPRKEGETEADSRPGWPSPWRKDVHLGITSCGGPARWLAMRAAAGWLLDYATVLRRGRPPSADDARVLEMGRCTRCGDGVEDAHHWMLLCPGSNSVAHYVRERHREIITRHIGLDISGPDIAWWIVPLAFGHVHPVAWNCCSRLAGGNLQQSNGTGCWGRSQGGGVSAKSAAEATSPTPAEEAPPADYAAREDASAPLDQWEEGPGPAHVERCAVCMQPMREALSCPCGARHCCGTADACKTCAAQEEAARETDCSCGSAHINSSIA
eukprot:gene1209-975_t